MTDKNRIDIAKLLRKVSREQHRVIGNAGRHGTKKGKKGYSRKVKHPKR